MIRYFHLLVWLLSVQTVVLASHGGTISGNVTAAVDNEPLVGAVIHLTELNLYTAANEIGHFSFADLPDGQYTLSTTYLGFEPQTQTIRLNNHETSFVRFQLANGPINLSDIEISATRSNPLEGFSQLDIQTRPVQSSQDILRLVPGLFIAQHAGGGKAEQIFLRGFDIDHGTDIALFVDDMPVNMVSHAHGQGYSDLHFLIPELAQQVDFQKGMYDARTGNFATAGQVYFHTPDALDQSFLQFESGQFNTHRLVSAINLLGKSGTPKNVAAYVAGEYLYADGYFDAPQHFNRSNLFGKYRQQFDNQSVLEVSVSDFKSSWLASGQVPERAVSSGQIGRFGSIDSTEGGLTGRTNLNLIHFYPLNDQTWVKNQFYLNRYDFELYSNFTFFLEDPVNGDQIRQREQRRITGLNSTITHHRYLGKIPIQAETGIRLRQDEVKDVELSHTRNRRETLMPLALGNVQEWNAAAFADLSVDLHPKLKLNAGVRFDQFLYQYADALQPVFVEYSAQRHQFSPKLSLNWTPSRTLQLFVRSGSGFHSNDSRTIVFAPDRNLLPRAWGHDLGVVWRPWSRLMLGVTGWYLGLQQEFVYVGDAGVVEPGGRTRRRGLDLSTRWQLANPLFFDLDYTWTHARSIDDPEGANMIPLAPIHTATGGFTFKSARWNGSLRARWLGDRPANPDYSLTATGYFLLDAQLAWTPRLSSGKHPLTFSLGAQNLLNTYWKEAQFETETRLRDEPAPVTEIHYTPGTPFNVKAGVKVAF